VFGTLCLLRVGCCYLTRLVVLLSASISINDLDEYVLPSRRRKEAISDNNSRYNYIFKNVLSASDEAGQDCGTGRVVVGREIDSGDWRDQGAYVVLKIQGNV
jgi:hypothetical protein